jgi:hypothetical protein
VSARRGQALILWTLTLLLLVLMVLVTLQLSMRARERVESQMVADTAAYSDAITVARTYNMTAVMNRAIVAEYVGLLGTESLISWSGMVRGSASQIAAALGGCGAGPQAARLMAVAAPGNAAWEQADDDAGEEARQQQGAAGSLRAATQRFYVDVMMGQQLQGQQLAARIANLACPELRAPPGADAKSISEVEPNCTTGAACLQGDGHDFMSAVMGSRGWVFTADRASGVNAGGTAVPVPVVGTGGSGFGDDPWYGTVEPGVPAERSQFNQWMDAEGAWAHDHGGTVTVRVGGCVKTVTVSSAFVMSSALEVQDDRHSYALLDTKRPEYQRHTLLSCPPAIPGCPAVIGGVLTFNRALLSDPTNDFGQPKLYAILERNYRARTTNEPWNLLFNFQFSRAGSGATFDNGNTRGSFLTPAGADLSRQVALGAGLVYYHRPPSAGGGGFLEPPNFFNPFWRATLAPPDRDAGDRLNAAGYPEAAAVYDALLARGYKGVP